MATMQKMGPSVLLNPKELYNLCIVIGLLPRPLDAAASNPSPVSHLFNMWFSLQYMCKIEKKIIMVIGIS